MDQMDVINKAKSKCSRYFYDYSNLDMDMPGYIYVRILCSYAAIGLGTM